MLKIVGGVLALVGAVVFLASTFLDYFFTFSEITGEETGAGNLWEVSTRVDVMLTVASVGVIALVLVALLGKVSETIPPAIALSGFTLGAIFFWDAQSLEGLKAGMWIGVVGALLMTVGTVLAAFGPTMRGASAAASTAAPAGAATGTPAGWYPDPSGAGGQRYWDGRTWTDSTRAQDRG